MTQPGRQTALVTGAARGIGAGIARRLVADGYRVMALDVLEEVQQLGTELGKACRPHLCDIRDRAALAAICAAEGPLDAIVNNAAITGTHPFEELTEEDFRSNFDVNVLGTFLVSQEGARAMKDGGRIVNIASRSFNGAPNMAHYATSKAAVVGLTRSMAIDLSPRDIKVNAVAPGVVDTEMLHYMNEEMQQKMLAWQLLGRIGQPDDIARAVSFLAAAENTYITGQVLIVDGGRSLGQGQLPKEASA
ncbi:MAG: short-chain dehydrogenase [Nioella sp.]|nr:short-chain dehydrogenase [Nioella sp.]